MLLSLLVICAAPVLPNIIDVMDDTGFYYRNVSLSPVKTCPGEARCVTHRGNMYKIQRRDTTEITTRRKKDHIVITLTPDSDYVAYYLYIQRRQHIRRIKMRSRRVVIPDGSGVYTLQISGVGIHGPEVLYQQTFRDPPVIPFSETLRNTANTLRAHRRLPPLTTDPALQTAGDSAMKRLTEHGTVHSTAATGSMRHSGIHRAALGENLFIAASEKRAWMLLQQSPSHLYNILNPLFRHLLIVTERHDGVIYGAMVFSN